MYATRRDAPTDTIVLTINNKDIQVLKKQIVPKPYKGFYQYTKQAFFQPKSQDLRIKFEDVTTDSLSHYYCTAVSTSPTMTTEHEVLAASMYLISAGLYHGVLHGLTSDIISNPHLSVLRPVNQGDTKYKRFPIFTSLLSTMPVLKIYASALPDYFKQEEDGYKINVCDEGFRIISTKTRQDLPDNKLKPVKVSDSKNKDDAIVITLERSMSVSHDLSSSNLGIIDVPNVERRLNVSMISDDTESVCTVASYKSLKQDDESSLSVQSPVHKNQDAEHIITNNSNNKTKISRLQDLSDTYNHDDEISDNFIGRRRMLLSLINFEVDLLRNPVHGIHPIPIDDLNDMINKLRVLGREL